MTSSDFVSTGEILSRALELLDDTKTNKGLGISHYETLVRDSIDALCLETHFFRVTTDILNWNKDGDFRVSLPKNLFNIRMIYIFNCGCCAEGSTSNKSDWSSHAIVHYKIGFNNKNEINTARITSIRDQVNITTRRHGSSGDYYYNKENDVLMFSPACDSFSHLRLETNAFLGDISDVPSVPRFAMDAIVWRVVKYAAFAHSRRDQSYRITYRDAEVELEGDGSIRKPGAWLKVQRFVKSMDKKDRDDMYSYLTHYLTK